MINFVVIKRDDAATHRELKDLVGPTEARQPWWPATALVRDLLKQHRVKVTDVQILFFANTDYDFVALRILLPRLVAAGSLDKPALERKTEELYERVVGEPSGGRYAIGAVKWKVIPQLRGWPIALEVAEEHGAKRATTKGRTRTPSTVYNPGDLVTVSTRWSTAVAEAIKKTATTLTVRYYDYIGPRRNDRTFDRVIYAGNKDKFVPTARTQVFRVDKNGSYGAGRGYASPSIWDGVVPQAWWHHD